MVNSMAPKLTSSRTGKIRPNSTNALPLPSRRKRRSRPARLVADISLLMTQPDLDRIQVQRGKQPRQERCERYRGIEVVDRQGRTVDHFSCRVDVQRSRIRPAVNQIAAGPLWVSFLDDVGGCGCLRGRQRVIVAC